jgi:tetratricopeptide (TPR) repeat protein
MSKIYHILLLMLFLPVLVMAQPNLTIEAYNAYQDQQLLEAKALIDRSVVSVEGKLDAMTHHIKGFIYKDLYNIKDKKSRTSENREIAIVAFSQSMKLDSKREFYDNNQKSLRYLASSYYNDAVLIIRDTDSKTINESEKLYNKFKETTKLIEAAPDFKEKDISYYKALATGNRKIYEMDRDANKEFLMNALSNYNYVLSLDPNDYGANYNMAINLYNEGAHNIEHLDNEAQIPAIVKVQAVSIELFKEALPYMLKAHELNPDREETLKGLRGIYLSLNDDTEANKYRDLLKDRQQTDKR